MASEQPKKRTRSKKGPLAIGGTLLAVGAAGYLALHKGDPEKVKGAQEDTKGKIEDTLEETPSPAPPTPPATQIKPPPKQKIPEPQKPLDKTDSTDAQEKIDYKGLDNTELLRLAKEGDVEAAEKIIERLNEVEEEIYKEEEEKHGKITDNLIYSTHRKILEMMDMTEEEYTAILQGSAIKRIKDYVYYKEKDPLEADYDFDELARRLDLAAKKNVQFDPLFLKLLGMSQSELQDFVRETLNAYSQSWFNPPLTERLKTAYGIE